MPTKSKTHAMPKFRKPSEELVTFFTQATAPMPGVEPRKMFSCPCAFINGNMFAGVFHKSVFLRLSPEDLAKFAKLGAVHFEPILGRPMREYMVVPPALMKSTTRFNAWLEKSFAYAASLPPKVPKRK